MRKRFILFTHQHYSSSPCYYNCTNHITKNYQRILTIVNNNYYFKTKINKAMTIVIISDYITITIYNDSNELK